MPFKSQAQMKYMFIHHPEIAKRWKKKYGVADLPKRLGKKGKKLISTQDVADRLSRMRKGKK